MGTNLSLPIDEDPDRQDQLSPKRTHETDLHKFGKRCFDYAEGRTINLPPAISPMFTPPKTFAIKRIDPEKYIPYAGEHGRKPDILLTNDQGHKLAVEIRNSNNKGQDYINDMNRIGISLILELNVNRWNENPSLIPDFSEGSPLQTAIDQTTWLSAGRPRNMQWKPYGVVLYQCTDDGNCQFCTTLRGGFIKFEEDTRLRLFYATPAYDLTRLAEETGLDLIATRKKVYDAVGSASRECEGVSIVTGTQGNYQIKDKDPSTTYRERGWVLTRDGAELERYRIRKVLAGFQPVIYEQSFASHHPTAPVVDDFIRNRDNNPLPVCANWRNAVEILFHQIAPQADPIIIPDRDDWKPTVEPNFQ